MSVTKKGLKGLKGRGPEGRNDTVLQTTEGLTKYEPQVPQKVLGLLLKQQGNTKLLNTYPHYVLTTNT